MASKKKITLEFDHSMTYEQKQVLVEKGTRGKKSTVRRYKKVEVKNPEAWAVITIENSVKYTPGERLDKSAVDRMCSGAMWEVLVGQPGQFKTQHSRY